MPQLSFGVPFGEDISHAARGSYLCGFAGRNPVNLRNKVQFSRGGNRYCGEGKLAPAGA